MVSNIDMLGVLFSDGIRGDKNRSLIISADWDGLSIVAELPKEGMHPDYLAATVRERHIFSLSG